LSSLVEPAVTISATSQFEQIKNSYITITQCAQRKVSYCTAVSSLSGNLQTFFTWVFSREYTKFTAGFTICFVVVVVVVGIVGVPWLGYCWHGACNQIWHDFCRQLIRHVQTLFEILELACF
jgi:hypothetical protein